MAQKVPFSYLALIRRSLRSDCASQCSPCGVSAENALPPQLSLCLSRACLGKKIGFGTNRRPKNVFSHGGRLDRQLWHGGGRHEDHLWRVLSAKAIRLSRFPFCLPRACLVKSRRFSFETKWHTKMQCAPERAEDFAEVARVLRLVDAREVLRAVVDAGVDRDDVVAVVTHVRPAQAVAHLAAACPLPTTTEAAGVLHRRQPAVIVREHPAHGPRVAVRAHGD